MDSFIVTQGLFPHRPPIGFMPPPHHMLLTRCKFFIKLPAYPRKLWITLWVTTLRHPKDTTPPPFSPVCLKNRQLDFVIKIKKINKITTTYLSFITHFLLASPLMWISLKFRQSQRIHIYLYQNKNLPPRGRLAAGCLACFYVIFISTSIKLPRLI